MTPAPYKTWTDLVQHEYPGMILDQFTKHDMLMVKGQIIEHAKDETDKCQALWLLEQYIMQVNAELMISRRVKEVELVG